VQQHSAVAVTAVSQEAKAEVTRCMKYLKHLLLQTCALALELRHASFLERRSFDGCSALFVRLAEPRLRLRGTSTRGEAWPRLTVELNKARQPLPLQAEAANCAKRTLR
jgi:hypothetical protein